MKRLPVPPVYHTFLVTAWQEHGRGAVQWRYTLEDAATGERLGFIHWDELVAVLGEQMMNFLGEHHDDTNSTQATD
ncbi:MAG: hypothetical protein KDE51_17680 [Anaerolineales bacterium]|nr:hypothetical protein [Anaerolineales bacterium]